MKKNVILTLSHTDGFAMIPKKNAQNNIKNRAFTLLELAVVIVIISLVASIGLSTGKDMIDTANYTATQNRLDAIEKALLAFWKKNGRLPCPANITLIATSASYGVEATSTATCAGGAITANFAAETMLYKSTEGGVPVTTLGLPKNFVYDAWGRRIAYAVTPAFAQPYASTMIPPKSGACANNNAAKAKDASGINRTLSSVYVLVSYGKNGHGGYGYSGSSRLNAGSTNTAEQLNCHCSSTAANTTYDGYYYQKGLSMSSTPANYFDDIVRYKERWQLATSEDALNDDGYRGPDLAVAFQKAVTGTVYVYKSQCGAFIKQPDLSPLPTESVRGVAFTAGNKHLLTYSALGCNLYKITGTGTLVNQASAFSTACTYHASGKIILSDNGYMAVYDTANIKLWKQSGDKFLKLPTVNDFAAPSTNMAFSPNATYLALLPTASGTTVPVYKRKGDIFSSITAPSHATATAKTSVAFSPDGKYLAATSSANIYLWRVLESGSFVALTTISPAGTTTMGSITFSPDGRYFAVGRAQTPYLLIYKIDPNDTFTQLSSPAGVPAASTGTRLAFSKDSNYLVMMTGTTTYPVLLFQRSSVSSFKYITYPFPIESPPTTPFDTILSSSAANAVAFSK